MNKADKKMDAKVGGSPSRPPEHRYRGATPGTATDEIEQPLRSFRSSDIPLQDQDDEEAIYADLTQAGAGESAENAFTLDPVTSDREYALSRGGEGLDENDDEISLELLGDAQDAVSDEDDTLADIESDEDEGLDRLPRNRPLRAERNL